MGAIFSFILLAWTAATWFSGPYGQPFLGFPLFGVNPLIPFTAFLLWSSAIFFLWLRRHGKKTWENINRYLHRERKTLVILGVILLLHLIVISLPAILNYWGENDSDSALHGLGGYHIADGKERPMYVYGSHYVGSLKAHIAALFHLVFGKSPITQRAIGTVFFLGFLVGLFMFVRRLFNEKTALLATALAAIPPFATAAQLRYDEFIELPFWGIIGLNLLLSLTQEKKDNWKIYFWYGVVLGIQFFAHPQAIYFMITGFLVLFAVDKLFFLRWRNWLIPLGMVIGTIPTWVDSYFHDWVIFRVFFSSEIKYAGHIGRRLEFVLNNLYRNLTEFWGLGPMFPMSVSIPKILIIAVMTAAALGFMYYLFISRQEIKEVFTRKRSVVIRLIPLLFALVVLGIFTLSAKTVLFGPFRYVYVLWMVIPIFIAAGATLPQSKWGKILGIGFLVISAALFSLSQFSYMKASHEEGNSWQQFIRFCRQKQITRFYGDFWLVYHTNFITKEEIIGSACFPFNNDPYMKNRETVDYSPKPPAYFFSPLMWEPALKQEVKFRKALDYLGIRYSRQQIDKHIAYYDLSEHLTPAQLFYPQYTNDVSIAGFSLEKVAGGEGLEEVRLVTFHCRNNGKGILNVDGNIAMAELVITTADGSLLRRQPLDRNISPGESFDCRAVLSLREMNGLPLYVHIKLNDIIVTSDKQPFILRPSDIDTIDTMDTMDTGFPVTPSRDSSRDSTTAKDIPVFFLQDQPGPGQLPEFMLINGWGKRLRPKGQLTQWSGGKQIEIAFLAVDPAKGIDAKLVLSPFYEKKFMSKPQAVQFYCNDMEISGVFPVTERTSIRLKLTPEMLRPGINRLRIKPLHIEPEYRRMRMKPGFNFRPRAFALHEMHFPQGK